MGMKACSECKREISTDANPCPHCGKKNPHGVSKIVVYGGAFVAVSFVLWVAAGALKKPPPTPAPQREQLGGATVPASVPERNRPERPALRVDAKEILAEYADNEVRADGKFKGKLIHVSGIAGDIKKDITGGIYVTVGTGAMLEIPTLQCFAKEGQEAAFAALSKGQKITVDARIDGLMMNVLGKDCIVNPTAQLCLRLREAAGTGECRDFNGEAALVIGGTAITPQCAPAERYAQVAQHDWGKAKFVGSKASGCFVLIQEVEKPPMPPDIAGKITAALDTL
jgi:hypothetical protein